MKYSILKISKIKSFCIFILLCMMLWACKKSDSSSESSNKTGTGGSMARFMIYGNYLYAVDNSQLKVMDIVNPAAPVYIKNIDLGKNIETIFADNGHLYIGSTTGVYIYSLQNPVNPEFMSFYQHILSCDPVVVQDNIAYATLRGGSECRQQTSGSFLDVIDVSNKTSPKLLRSYSTLVSEPYGLGVDSNLLFVCDGSKGLKIFDCSTPANLIHKKTISGITTYDVIPMYPILLVIGQSGFFQYNYTNPDSIFLVSSIQTSK